MYEIGTIFIFFKIFFDLLHRKVLENFHSTSQIFPYNFSLHFFYWISSFVSMFVVPAPFCLISKINWMQTNNIDDAICTFLLETSLLIFYDHVTNIKTVISVGTIKKICFIFIHLVSKKRNYVKKNMKWKLLI